jgi:uncharacterized protein YjbJ (UPF0337 family)
MNREIRNGRWMQLRGRAKRAWARLIGDERMGNEANAEIVTGALEESVGIARRDAAKKVTRVVDRLAGATKRFAHRLGA